MAVLTKCPRCQIQIDVTGIAGGSTVQCPDCGSMMRVPSPASAPAAAPPPQARPNRQTSLFRRMSRAGNLGARRKTTGHGEYAPRSSNAGVWIGLGVGFACLLLVLVVVAANRKSDIDEKNRRTTRDKEAMTSGGGAEEMPVDTGRSKSGTPDPRKAPSLVKRGKDLYDVPATFQPGAREQARTIAGGEFHVMQVDETEKRAYLQLVADGRVADIVRDDSKWIPFIIDGMLSDDERVARSSLQSLHDICARRQISATSNKDDFKNPVDMGLLNSAYYRASQYNFWTIEWWLKPVNQKGVRDWAAMPDPAKTPAGHTTVAESPERVDWDRLMQALKGGGKYDDPTRPEGVAFSRIRAMGRSAFPWLIRYIDHEDIMLGRGAVTVLNTLTEQTRPLPTETTKAQQKTEWDAWYKKN